MAELIKTDYSKDKTIMGYMYKALADSLDKKKANRKPEFELLRIVSMMMVIVLHYLSKGGIIDLSANGIGEGKALFWILEALCLVAVNAYVLLSGYFLTKSEISLAKIIGIWCQVFFYSVVIAVLAVIVGISDVKELLCLKNILFFVFPATNGHYWFFTAYFVMYLFGPVIAKGIKELSESQLKLVILVALIPTCFLPSISPFALVTDDRGNSFVWFIMLFMIAGYIRLYGIKILENNLMSFIVYILSAVLIVFCKMGFSTFVSQHPGYEQLLLVPVHYNFVFVLSASLAFFYLFKNMKLKENLFTKFLVRISPFVFAVYLIHEHLLIRYEWVKWFKVADSFAAFRIVHIILTVIIIFAIGIILDIFRYYFFHLCKIIMIFCLNIYFAKREVWDYLIFGVFATVVNWIAYIASAYCLLIPLIANDDLLLKQTANIISWVAAVVFAYWTNRSFVFKSKVEGFVEIIKEFATFVGARLFSFAVEQILFFVSLKMSISDIVAKLAISIVVIILNYLFSKLFVFKKKKA